LKNRDNKWKILMVILIGSFMTTLDINIVNVALPKMSVSLSVGINSIQWVVTSYLIVVSSLVLGKYQI
jgi:MFS family permease